MIGVTEMEYNADIHNLQCPKCKHGMEEVTLEDITIDRCTGCQGLWFDDGLQFWQWATVSAMGHSVGDRPQCWRWTTVLLMGHNAGNGLQCGRWATVNATGNAFAGMSAGALD